MILYELKPYLSLEHVRKTIASQTEKGKPNEIF